MRVGATLYAARSAVNTSRRSMVLPLLVREVHISSEGYSTIQVECVRCGQRQRIQHTEFLSVVSGRDYLMDLSSMPPCEEKYRILGHSQNCWERGYLGTLVMRTAPDYDYVSVTAIPVGEMPGVHEDREPIRIGVNQYGEQIIEDRPNTLREHIEEVNEKARAFIREAVKPFTKEERRRKQRKKLIEVNCRMIRED